MDIGIDLGTTFSVIAVKGKVETAPGYPPAEYLEQMDVSILPSANGNFTFPSVFWWHPDAPDRYIFGDEAKQMAEEGKAPIMFSKRCIGTTNQLILNGRVFTSRDVASHFLRHLKEWAETVTGHKVHRAVVTHPAYFTPNQRDETLKAAQEAGLDTTSEQLMMEPCAAALAYTLNDTRDPLRVMTYDLGGGTFDVAVMEKIEGVIQMKKFHGNHLIGGCNFDRAFVQWILDQLKVRDRVIPYDENNEEHKGRRARMLQVAETVKVKLGEARTDKQPVPVQVDFLVDNQGQKVQFRSQINREQYTALIQEELQETIQCCRSALEGAGMKAEELDAILLVGGSTYGKWIKDLVAKEFGIVHEPYFPDYCVAAGAALYVAQLPPPPSETGQIRLSLDYPSTSLLPFVNISGRVCPILGSDLTPEACQGLQVCLDTPEGNMMGPVEISEGGQFVFSKIPLLQDSSLSSFKVTVSENEKELLITEGTIVYTDTGNETGNVSISTPIVPVLPRPLFLQAERMVAIAEEGASLPVKCEVRLRRTFDMSSLKIPIFMGSERVGEVCIEDIPDEAGQGCLVVVDVEVSQSNEMFGKVFVYGPNNKTVVKEGAVRVQFPPIVIPALSELLGQFDELKDRLEEEISQAAATQDRARLAGPGRTLVRKIRQISEGESPDTQLLHEKIKELNRIVHPPKDDMDPPRRDFENIIAECHEILASDPENKALKAYASQLDRVEIAGKDACETKNNKKWTNANEALQKITTNMKKVVGKIIDQPPPTLPPTPVLKAQGTQIINGLRADLKTAREARLREKNPEFWFAVCEKCEQVIDNMASEIRNISDDVPSDQAMGKIQSCLIPSDVLRKKISRIKDGIQVET